MLTGSTPCLSVSLSNLPDGTQEITCVPDVLSPIDAMSIQIITGGQSSSQLFVSVVDNSVSSNIVLVVRILATIIEAIILVSALLVELIFWMSVMSHADSPLGG